MNMKIKANLVKLFLIMITVLFSNLCNPKTEQESCINIEFDLKSIKTDTVEAECQTVFELCSFSEESNSKKIFTILKKLKFAKIDTFFVYEHNIYIKTFKAQCKNNKLVYIQKENNFMIVGADINENIECLITDSQVFEKNALEKTLRKNIYKNCVVKITDISGLQYIELTFIDSKLSRFIYSNG